jgi:hypothetical protein
MIVTLLLGWVNITLALSIFFAYVACLFTTGESAPQMRHKTSMKGTYVEHLQESDLTLSKCGRVLSPRSTVLCITSGLEEGVSSCVRIHLMHLYICELHLMLAQRCTICTVLFQKMHVF